MHPTLRSTLALVVAAVVFFVLSASGQDNQSWARGPMWLGYVGWFGFLILVIVLRLYMVVSRLRHRDRPSMRLGRPGCAARRSRHRHHPQRSRLRRRSRWRQAAPGSGTASWRGGPSPRAVPALSSWVTAGADPASQEECMIVRVLIVDDQDPFRAAARMVVEFTDGFEVVGEATTGEDSVVTARVLKPDLVLMDVNLPGIGGLEAAKQILTERTPPVVLVLSTYEPEEYAPRVAEVGGAAYIPKSGFDPAALAGAWEAATAGTHGAAARNAARNAERGMMVDALEVRGLRRTFASLDDEGATVRALRGIDLAVAEAEFVAIMGPSGCGKSTLLNLVAGLDSPTEGSIRVGGHQVTDLGEDGRARFRRRHIGIVFQFFNLLEGMSVLENVVLPIDHRRFLSQSSRGAGQGPAGPPRDLREDREASGRALRRAAPAPLGGPRAGQRTHAPARRRADRVARLRRRRRDPRIAPPAARRRTDDRAGDPRRRRGRRGRPDRAHA